MTFTLRLKETLIQQIDAHDSGVEIYNVQKASPYDIDKLVESFYPNWQNSKQDYDSAFNEVVNFATKLLKNEID